MDKHEIERCINIFEEMTEYIANTIAYADITDIKYEIDDAMDELICILKFSRGTSEYLVGITWCGIIDQYSKKIPKMLLVDIHNAICGRYLKGIIELTRENVKSSKD